MAFANRDEISLASIDAEIENRQARASLLSYTLKTTPDYIAERIHRQVASALEALARREITRLMITAPPRHGKTALISQRFPVWYLSQPEFHRHEVIHAGYGSEIVEDAGRELRNLLGREEHLDVFPDVRLAGDSRAANHWRTTSGGVYIAAGTRGAIVGRGGDLICLDDVTKGDVEAHSPTVQDQTWRWFQSDVLSRRHANSVMVIVGTRWTDVDLMGRLLQEAADDGRELTHLHYPAIDDDGEACAPSRIPLTQLEETRRTVPPRVWSSLYQGNPTPAEGALFPADKLIEYGPDDLMMEIPLPAGPDGKVPDAKRIIPRPMTYYGASDFAVSDGKGDYTVHIVVGVDPLDNIYIMDLWREQASPDESINAMIGMMRRWKTTAWAQEKGALDKALTPFMQRRMTEERAYFHMVRFASATDKATRAQSILGRISMGKVRFPRAADAPWWPILRDELIRFPHGKHDDQVDTMSLVGRMIAGMITGSMPNEGLPHGTPGLHINTGQSSAPVKGHRPMTLNDLWKEEERLKPRRRRRR